MTRYEIRLAGSGGQGLILAGIILAEAAGIYDGKFVCQTQSYGPEARGGTSKAEVVISDTEIDYPRAIRPDVLLAMNQKSLDIYLGDLKPDALLVVDATLVKEIPDHHRAFAIPFTQMAREGLGKTVVANIVALGALAALTGAVTREGLEAAVLARVPPGTEELNRQALAAGLEAAAKLR
jgi:2-oxoglutarate ferredoxin oxidoreductase subunit gamma